jgi:hypothetical protein
LEFGAFWRHIQMKRRVFSKTTPFHTFKKKKQKKKKEQNGVVLNDTVHLPSFPRTCSGEEGKRVALI